MARKTSIHGSKRYSPGIPYPGEENEDRDKVVKLETDIDDCSGEVLGYVMKKLFKAGAKDVHYAPIFMKKNRPAWELTVICREDKAEELEQIIFTETTTIGIREYPSGALS